jgi:fatty acid desaturase
LGQGTEAGRDPLPDDDGVREFEWPTLLLAAATYGIWALALVWLSTISLWLAVPVMAWAAAQHSSLTHEALHGHPFRSDALNSLLVALPLTIFIPYERFRDLHLAHHRDEFLTDPYDDPESNYMDPAVWDRLSAPVRALLRFNNTLCGRITVGPAIGTFVFLRAEARLIAKGCPLTIRAWALHLPALALLTWFVILSPTPVWAFILQAYIALGLLRIRTFLEHRAHEKARGRSVVIEDQGPLALLFLNNNFHVVHHMHPRLPWYRLPAAYAARRAHYLARNDGYLYRSYGQVIREHLFRAKDPVPHPVWQPEDRQGRQTPVWQDPDHIRSLR